MGLHLTPCLILLQLASEDITLSAVLLGYLASRVWSCAITTHHLTVDWDLWNRAGRVPLHVYGQSAGWQGFTAYVKQGVINDVYGFSPPAPKEFYVNAVWLELASSCVMAAIACLDYLPSGLAASLGLPDGGRAEIFRVMGAGRLVPVETLTSISVVCTAVGVSALFGGAAVAFLFRVVLPKRMQASSSSSSSK